MKRCSSIVLAIIFTAFAAIAFIGCGFQAQSQSSTDDADGAVPSVAVASNDADSSASAIGSTSPTACGSPPQAGREDPNFGSFTDVDVSTSVNSDTLADNLKKIPADCDQLILTVGEGEYNATIYCFERKAGAWAQMDSFKGFIGKNGMGKSAEGDKKSPVGYYPLGTAFGRAPNPGTKMPYRKITKNDYWDDDAKSPTYNTWQTNDPPKTEKMDITAYDYGFVIDYNPERVPGLGSAIFFHCANSFTDGCTGAAKKDVISVLKWLDPQKNPWICQCSREDLSEYLDDDSFRVK